MANNVSGRKCPNCGSALRYDPESSRLICDFCDSGFTIEEVDAADREQAQQVGSMNFTAGNEALQNLKAYVCSSCGAEVVADPQTVSLVCPYCGSNIVLSDKINGELCPDGIIPFAITPKALPQAVRNFYKGKKLLPRYFFSDASIGTVQGIYVPFWLYDSNPAGEMIFNGSKDRTYRDGDYVVTEHRNYELHRNVSMSFHDIPTDASERMEDALMDSLEPFDFSAMKAFNTDYLAGYVADRWDKNAKEMKARTDRRVYNSAVTIAMTNATAGYSDVNLNHRSHLDMSNSTARFVLLPVYVFDIKWNNQAYSFAVNGQTGKVVGTLPEDKALKTRFFLKWWAIGAAVLMAVNWLLFLH